MLELVDLADWLLLEIPTEIEGTSLIMSSGIRMFPFFGVLEGSCWGGSDSNLSTANETLFNETVDRSFTVSAGEGSTGVGGLLAVGATPLIGDDISFTRESGVATALVPPDSLSVVLVLTTGNGFLAVEAEDEVDRLLNKDPKIDLLVFSPLVELLLLRCCQLDGEEIGGCFPLPTEEDAGGVYGRIGQSLVWTRPTALDIEVERFFLTN